MSLVFSSGYVAGDPGHLVPMKEGVSTQASHGEMCEHEMICRCSDLVGFPVHGQRHAVFIRVPLGQAGERVRFKLLTS